MNTSILSSDKSHLNAERYILWGAGIVYGNNGTIAFQWLHHMDKQPVPIGPIQYHDYFVIEMFVIKLSSQLLVLIYLETINWWNIHHCECEMHNISDAIYVIYHMQYT